MRARWSQLLNAMQTEGVEAHYQLACAPPTHQSTACVAQRTITFQNARDGGFMRTFTGKWEVQPFSQVGRAAAGVCVAWRQPASRESVGPCRLGQPCTALSVGGRRLCRMATAMSGHLVTNSPHLPFPTQDTLDRIYRPEDHQHQGRRGLGWLNPVGALGALQHRERRGWEGPCRRAICRPHERLAAPPCGHGPQMFGGAARRASHTLLPGLPQPQ
jgi:hypothetical protein